MRALFAFYRVFVSPVIHALGGPGMGCRFQPTCSEYSKEALEKHGLVRGSILTLKRIGRCNPLSQGGWDPVP